MSKKIEDKTTGNKYIWEREICAMDGLTVWFTDWTSMILTERQFGYMVTNEAKDASEFRNLIVVNVVRDVMEILEKHDIRKWELQPIVQTIISSYNHAFSRAIWKAFWTYEEWLPVETQAENIRMSDIKNILDDKENTEESK